MQKNMPKWGTVLMATVIVAWVGGWVPPVFAKNALVEVTGQTTSYAEGDDGDIQAGVPFPTPRFTDKGNGTVKDMLTGLIWLKDASCLGSRTWEGALAAIEDLNRGTDFSCADYSAGTFDDWRLPNVKELKSLIHFGFFAPALSNAEGTAKWAEGDAFSAVQSAFYWSSTTFAQEPTSFAWIVLLNEGITQGGFKVNPFIVWPVQ